LPRWNMVTAWRWPGRNLPAMHPITR